jgi:hypothetical protein
MLAARLGWAKDEELGKHLVLEFMAQHQENDTEE